MIQSEIIYLERVYTLRKSAVFALVLIICLCSCTNKPAVSNTVYAEEKEPTTFNIPDIALGETFRIKAVETQNTLLGVEKYPYSAIEEQFVHSYLKGFYKSCCDLRRVSDIPIEPAGTVISVSKPFALYAEDSNGSFFLYPDKFSCVFIVEGHIVGNFSVSGVNTGNPSYSSGYNEPMVKSLEKRIGLPESAKMAVIVPSDGTAPYAEVLEITGENHESGVWFSFMVE